MDTPILASVLSNSEFIQGMGIFLMAMGYTLFISSVIVRGRYSVSWEMPKDHKLIVMGPYRYIRHPSYIGYFLMFTGRMEFEINRKKTGRFFPKVFNGRT